MEAMLQLTDDRASSQMLNLYQADKTQTVSAGIRCVRSVHREARAAKIQPALITINCQHPQINTFHF